MSKISNVLTSSFERLVHEPRFFVPKLFSTFLSSLFIVYILEGKAIRQMVVSDPLYGTSVLLGTMLTLGVIGVFASLMVASMVKHREEEGVLKLGFDETAENFRQVLSTALIFFFVSFAVAIPASIGIYLFMAGLGMVGAAFLLLSFLLLMAVTFASYFLPITLLEKKSLAGGLSESFKTSSQNSIEVVLLTVFSMLLLGVAFFFASSPYLEALGYAGFILGRLISTTVNTYLFVVSPTFYLENE